MSGRWVGYDGGRVEKAELPSAPALLGFAHALDSTVRDSQLAPTDLSELSARPRILVLSRLETLTP